MSTRGFTLVELMIVLAILGLMGAFAVPNLPRWSAGLRLNALTREIASELQLARVKAIAQNTSITICFYRPNATFPEYTNGYYSTHLDSTQWCNNPPARATQAFTQFALTVKKLPTGIQVTPPADNDFTFNSRGQLAEIGSHMDLKIPAAPQTKRITVHFTGRVHIEAL